ncbi:MAG: ATP-binding protein [Myxococcota bacterium]
MADLLSELLDFAEAAQPGPVPGADSDDPRVQRLRALIERCCRQRRELSQIEQTVDRLIDAVTQYAKGNLEYQFPLRDGGQPIDALATGLVMMAEELRARSVELEAARDAADHANEAKSTFLANMSHELRTPLNAILGYAELVLEEAEGAEPISGDAAQILRSGKILLALVSDVLDMAKIEAGKMVVVLEPVAVPSLCAELLDSLRPIADGRRNTLELTCATGLVMVSDVGKIRQILTNLLANALKFTDRGTVRLDVSADEQWVRCEVTDTGVGIPADRLGQLFMPFVQADATVHRRYGGTGLGLALARHLARLLGGDVTAESQLGVGSTFRVTLARHWRASETSAPAPRAASPDLRRLTAGGVAAYLTPRRTHG